MGNKLQKRLCVALMSLVSSASLVACTSVETSQRVEIKTSEMKQDMHKSEGGHDMETLPVPFRLAFMSGHVQAGLALYRAGEPEMAAPHLLHPVSETHQTERAGLDALGFTPDVFESVSEALEAGRPASEIEPDLLKAEANLKSMAEAAGGDKAEIIRFLMDTIVEEYTIAITDGIVSDPGEYQDAYGFAVVAKDHAMSLYDAGLLGAIEELLQLWPSDAPIPPTNPTSVAQVTAKATAVKRSLR